MSKGRRRVRVITDPVKYRRHMRKKFFRTLARLGVWVLVAAVALLLFWFVLERMLQPPPQE
jgi:hypothetical protein